MLSAAIPTQATLTSFEPSGEATLDRKVAPNVSLCCTHTRASLKRAVHENTCRHVRIVKINIVKINFVKHFRERFFRKLLHVTRNLE